MTGFIPQYDGHSLYRVTNLTNRYLANYIHRPIIPHAQDQVRVIKDFRYHHAPDLFALEYYGDEDLFWVVPVRSGFQDLIFDFVVGATIIVPYPGYIKDQFA
jgi:hypothetical protein